MSPEERILAQLQSIYLRHRKDCRCSFKGCGDGARCGKKPVYCYQCGPSGEKLCDALRLAAQVDDLVCTLVEVAGYKGRRTTPRVVAGLAKAADLGEIPE